MKKQFEKGAKYVNEVIYQAYVDLATAIVIQAIEDYRIVLSKIKKYCYTGNINSQNYRTLMYDKEVLERFFLSNELHIYTTLDGMTIIKEINNQIMNGKAKPGYKKRL